MRLLTQNVISQEYKGKTWLQIALMTFESFLKARIISNANDQLALVFYGTVSFCLLTAWPAASQRSIPFVCLLQSPYTVEMQANLVDDHGI